MAEITHISSLEPIYAEQWVAGTYVVSGSFFLESRGVTPELVMAQVEPLYQKIRLHKKAIWPRGLAGFFVIPIICGPDFGDDLKAWVRTRHPYKWAIWLEPSLYNTSTNAVALREDYGLFGKAFFPYLTSLVTAALNRAALQFGYTEFPRQIHA